MVQHALLIVRRPATADDEAFARHVHHTAMREVVVRQFGPWDEAMQDAFFDGWWRQGRAQIVSVDGVDAGYVDVDDRGDELVVHELVLLPAAQGRGVGSQLLADVFALGKPVQLQVLHENHRARALYERLGFTEIDRNTTHHVLRRAPATSVR